MGGQGLLPNQAQWVYTPNSDLPIPDGGSLTDTFTVSATDGTSQVVTVTIHDEFPVITGDINAIVVTPRSGGSYDGQASGNLIVTDADATTTPGLQAITGTTADGGIYFTHSDGFWHYGSQISYPAGQLH